MNPYPLPVSPQSTGGQDQVPQLFASALSADAAAQAVANLSGAFMQPPRGGPMRFMLFLTAPWPGQAGECAVSTASIQ